MFAHILVRHLHLRTYALYPYTFFQLPPFGVGICFGRRAAETEDLAGVVALGNRVQFECCRVLRPPKSFLRIRRPASGQPAISNFLLVERARERAVPLNPAK